jgi:glutathione S-transferase
VLWLQNTELVKERVNGELLMRSYVAGDKRTIADFALYATLRGVDCSKYTDLSRWLRHIEHLSQDKFITAHHTPAVTNQRVVLFPLL